MIISFIILAIFGVTLVGAGIWVVFITQMVNNTSDINRVLIFGWIGAAFTRLFFDPQTYKWLGWKKNLLGFLFVFAGAVLLYGAYLIIDMDLI